MDAKEIEALNAHAEKVAGKLGVRATVGLVAPERSQVNTANPQILLTVFREISGRMEERSAHLRMDRQDLKDVIEQEIGILASQLTGRS
jgi:hypothetical protein